MVGIVLDVIAREMPLQSVVMGYVMEMKLSKRVQKIVQSQVAVAMKLLIVMVQVNAGLLDGLAMASVMELSNNMVQTFAAMIMMVEIVLKLNVQDQVL